MLSTLVTRLRGVLSRRRVARETDDELSFHIEQETAAHIQRGVPPNEARRLALRDLGGLTQVSEAVSDVRATWADRAFVNLKGALRGLRRGRSTTVLAFGMLSLTMAVGTVTYSVVDGVAIRPLPYREPARLVGLSNPAQTAGKLMPATPQQYFVWREGAQSFDAVGASRFTMPVRIEAEGVDRTLVTMSVTANLFEVLGVRPILGQSFSAGDEMAGAPARVLLSHALWTGSLHADPLIVGRSLMIGGQSRMVAGVLPAGVAFPLTLATTPEIYTPYIPVETDRSNDRALTMSVVGRLKPGVSVEQARADVTRLSTAIVLPLQEQVVGGAKTWLLFVLAAVGILQIIACINVAHLLLLQAVTRGPEFATREALGASRARLALGLLLEGSILSGASVLVGLFAAYLGIEFVKAQLPADLTRVSSIAIDLRVVAASILVSTVSTLLFATAPAWLVARNDLMSFIKSSGGPVLGGRRRDRFLATFLVADIALVSVLLVATSLVVTSFILVTTADLGFDRRNAMSVGYRIVSQSAVPAERASSALVLRNELLERVRAVPGVIAAAISANAGPPLIGGSVRYSIEVPGVGEIGGDEMLETRMVTPDYFKALGMRVLRGRAFTESDRAGTPQVMMLNEAAAHRLFPGRDPIGQTVIFRGPTTIVGVFHGLHIRGPEADAPTEMYTPVDQDSYYNNGRRAETNGTLVVRTAQDPRQVAPAVREVMRLVLNSTPEQAMFIDDGFRRLTAARRFNAMLMATFGCIAVAIGAVGVYGTMAFVVARRLKTMGLRMALGATPSSIVRLVMRQALKRVALGLVLGLAGAWAVSAAFKAFVFGVGTTEPLVYAGVGVFIAALGCAAALVPALRASRVDVLTTLRAE